MGRKNLLIGFIIIIAAITLFSVFGDNGLLDVYRLGRERDRIVERNTTIEEENKRLAEELELLKNDKRYVAAIARKELGMIGKNEVIYMIDEAEADRAQGGRASEQPRRP